MRVTALAAILTLGFAAAPALAEESDEVSDADVSAINALLAGMNCEVDEDNIEKDEAGFELDDVICADGQFDIDLDPAYAVVEKRAE